MFFDFTSQKLFFDRKKLKKKSMYFVPQKKSDNFMIDIKSLVCDRLKELAF